jgi:hypothetical protein
MGRETQKDELIQMHTFLLQLRTHLENMVKDNNPKAFLSYEKLNIGPHKINRDKNEHKLAVFELCKGITNLLQESNCSVFQRIYDDLEKMCNRFRK